jgi:large repetitive protein
MPIQAIGQEILVNNLTNGNQYRPAVAATANGGFIIVWQDESGQSGDFSQGDIRYKKFTALGDPLQTQGFGLNDDIRVNLIKTGAQSNPTIAVRNDGKFLVGWTDANGFGADIYDRAVAYRVMNTDGSGSSTKLANQILQQSQDEPSAVALGNGQFAVSWSSDFVA